VKRTVPLLIALGIGALLWKTGAFGFMALERTLVWRLPVSYAQVRHLELQVWDEQTLLASQDRATPSGLTAEPELKVSLEKGAHRAIARVTLEGQPEPKMFQKDFDPGGDETMVLELKP